MLSIFDRACAPNRSGWDDGVVRTLFNFDRGMLAEIICIDVQIKKFIHVFHKGTDPMRTITMTGQVSQQNTSSA